MPTDMPLEALLEALTLPSNQMCLVPDTEFMFSDGLATWNPINQNPELTALPISPPPPHALPHTPPYPTHPTSLFQR